MNKSFTFLFRVTCFTPTSSSAVNNDTLALLNHQNHFIKDYDIRQVKLLLMGLTRLAETDFFAVLTCHLTVLDGFDQL